MKSLYFFSFTLLLVSCGTLTHNKIRYSKVSKNNTEQKRSQSLDHSSIYKSSTESVAEIENAKGKTMPVISEDVASTEDLIPLTDKNKPALLDLLPQECDVILLRSGDEIKAKVTEIGTDVIKYKRCDNLDGPTISVRKNDVFMITYSNGSKDVFQIEKKDTKEVNQTQVNRPSNQRTHGLAIASFVLGLVSVLPLLGIILGGVALKEINENPEEFKGRGLAQWGIALSIIWLVLILVLVLLL